MNEIIEVLNETGFKTYYKLEENDLWETYKDMVLENPQGENPKNLREDLVSHLIGTLDGILVSNVPKHIPQYSLLTPGLQGQLLDIFGDYKIFYDRNKLNFFITHKGYGKYGEELEELVNSSKEAISIILEMYLPSELARFMFMDNEQQKNEVENLLMKAISQMATQYGLFEKLMITIPEVVLSYGNSKFDAKV